MDLALTEQQEMLRTATRDFLDKNCPKSLVKKMEEDELGYPPELWKAIGDMGWLGLVIPEQFGGGGGDFLDLCVLLEEMGRALLPGPFLPTVISEYLFAQAGTLEQKEAFLPRMASGKLIVIPAWSLPDMEYDVSPRAIGTAKNGNTVISGSKLFVPYARGSDFLISQVYTGEAQSVFILDSRSKGLKFNPLTTVSGERQYEVEYREVTASPETLLGKLNSGQDILNKVLPIALVAKSMLMLGGAQRVTEMSVEYAKSRVQFDHPIGSFQAIQHYAANMVIDLDTARFLAYRTAWMINQDQPCLKEAYMTKAWMNDAYRRIAVLGKQIHGGHGVVTEFDFQLYFRRQKADEVFIGDSDLCREKVAQLVLA